MKLTNDMLKEGGKYSIARVLLFASFIFFCFAILLLMVRAFHPDMKGLDLGVIKEIIGALKYPIGTFGGYLVVGKFAKAENKAK